MTRVGRHSSGRPKPGGLSPAQENFHPGRAPAQAVGRQQLRQALLPGDIFRERQAKGPGRGPQALQVLGQELHPPILGPQGFEQAVAVEEPPVVHRHPGLGKRD